MSIDSNKRSVQSDTPMIKTATHNNASRRNVTTSSDVVASYERKAQQASEQSKIRVHNIGSEQFVKSNVLKNLNVSTSTVSDNASKNQHKSANVVKGLAFAENSHNKYGGVIRTESVSKLNTAQSLLNKNITSSAVEASEHASAVRQKEQSNNRKIAANSALSTACYMSFLRGEHKYSADVRKVLHDVRNFSQGDLEKVDVYARATPYMKDGKFQYNVLKRRVFSEGARKDISRLSADKSLNSSVKIVGKEAFATYHERMLMYSLRERSVKEMFMAKLPLIASAVNTASSKLFASDDLGAQTAQGVVIGAQVLVVAAKGARKVDVFIASVPQRIKNMPSNAVKGVKNNIRAIGVAGEKISATGYNIKTSVVKGYRFVRNTAVTVHTNGFVSKVTLSKVGHHTVRGIAVGTRGVAKSATHIATAGTVDLLNGRHLIAASGAAVGIGGLLEKSDNEYIRGTGTALKVTNFAIKTSVSTAKTSGYVVKTAVKKTGEGISETYHAMKFLKERGLKASLKLSAQKAHYRAIKSARKGATALSNGISDIINGITRRVTALLIPVICSLLVVIIIGGGLMFTTTIFSGSFGIVGSIIGGVFSNVLNIDVSTLPLIGIGGEDKDDVVVEFDVEEFLNNKDYGVPKLREEYINSLVDYVNNRKTDIIRIRMSGSQAKDVINLDGDSLDSDYKKSIESVFYSDKQIIEIIQPIFQTKLLMEYDLQLSDKQAQKCLKDIFKELFPSDKKDFDKLVVETTEHCGQDQNTGLGTPFTDSSMKCFRCGKYHDNKWTAISSKCPHYETHYHSSYTCKSCDKEWYTCNEKMENGGEGRNVCDREGTVLMNGDSPLVVYGHWEGISVWETTSDYQINIQHFHQHGSVMSNQKDVIERVKIYYEKDPHSGAPIGGWVRWETDGYMASDDDISRGKMIVDDIEYEIKKDGSSCSNSEYHFDCSGYNVCLGHTVSNITISLSGYETLLNKEFIEPMNKLNEAIGKVDSDTELSDKEAEELANNKEKYQQLKESLEMCYEYQDVLFDKFMSVNDFKKLQNQKDGLLSEDDTNKALVEFALSFVGKIGGDPYKKWYYKDADIPKNVEWSGCFIVYCMENQDHDLKLDVLREPSARMLQKDNSEFIVSREESLKNKNLIHSSKSVVLLSPNGSKTAQRCGLVIGKSKDYIYVVEGNCADRICLTKYEYDDTQIIGYIMEE